MFIRSPLITNYPSTNSKPHCIRCKQGTSLSWCLFIVEHPRRFQIESFLLQYTYPTQIAFNCHVWGSPGADLSSTIITSLQMHMMFAHAALKGVSKQYLWMPDAAFELSSPTQFNLWVLVNESNCSFDTKISFCITHCYHMTGLIRFRLV